MKSLALFLTIWVSLGRLAGAPVADDAGGALEREVGAMVAGPQVTVVHFWAPWCPNCKSEMASLGWQKFVEANPGVRVVFLSIWHRNLDAAPALQAAGLGMQPNFIARTDRNASGQRGEKLETFLGFPVQWVPTTWVYRQGKLRYALNYGEVRFAMLQQMVTDAAEKW